MADEQRRETGDPFREGVRAVTGILGALRDAIEETFDELKQQGELSPERAKEAARSTMRKAQDAVDDVRGRIDFVARREFDALREEVAELRRRLDRMDGSADGAGPTGGPPPGGGGPPLDASGPAAPSGDAARGGAPPFPVDEA